MENQKVDEQSTKQVEEVRTTETGNVADKLSAVGWALFFIWVGIALLMKVGAGVGLLGVGIITLAVQAVRKCFNLKLEVFWVVIGLLFVLGAIWELFQPKLPFVPILLIVAGSALLVSVVMRKAR